MTTTLGRLSVASPWRFRLRLAATVLAGIVAWPARVVRARRMLAQLGGMDDRELRDIGLCRQDLRDSLALRPDADPSIMLQRRARQRRC